MNLSTDRKNLQPTEWIKCAVITALLVGACDYAIGFGVFVTILGAPPLRVLQHPASAVLGPAAYQGGARTAALCVLFHFLIALIWSVAYIVLYRLSPALRRFTSSTAGLLVVAVVAGIFIWVFMNTVVLPLSLTRPYPIDSGIFWVVLAGHIPFVGLPLVLSVRRFCPLF